MSTILTLFKRILIISVFSLFLAICIGIYFLWKFSPELPSYRELKNYNPSLTSRVFSSDGLLLDKYFIEERIFVPIDRMPQKLIESFISAENEMR